MNASSRSRFVRLIDGLVNAVAPTAAIHREVARQKLEMTKAFRYSGARVSRLRGHSTSPLQSPESSGYASDRVGLMREARDLAENGELASSLLLKFQAYVAGSLRYQARTGDRAVDDEYEEYWNAWAESADFTGRHSFRKLVQLALSEALTGGDAGLVLRRQDDQLSLLGIEADRIGNPNELNPTESYFSGVILDAEKRPRAYRVYNRTLNGSYDNPIDVPAMNFLHVFNPLRFDQYRGVTAFASVIETLRDVKEIIEYEKVAVKWGSAQAGIVTEDKANPANPYFEDGTDENTGEAKRLETIEPGRINYVQTGGQFAQFRVERPGPAWSGFIQLLIRLYGHGLGLPYGYVFDMSGLGGPASRFESELAKRTFDGWKMLLKEKVLNRVRAVVLANGIAFDRLPAHRNFLRGLWQFPAHPTIDMGRESAANLNENRQGLRSMDTILGEEGLDGGEEREQVVKEAKDWMELAAKHGVPLDQVRLMTPNGPPATATASSEPAPAPA